MRRLPNTRLLFLITFGLGVALALATPPCQAQVFQSELMETRSEPSELGLVASLGEPVAGAGSPLLVESPAQVFSQGVGYFLHGQRL